MYSYLNTGLLVACILMLPTILFVWCCLGRKSKGDRSEIVQEIMDFKPSTTTLVGNLQGSGQKPLPSQPDDIIAPPLEVPEFEIETQNSFEDGGSFRFDQDDLKKNQKLRTGDPIMTDTDRREINDSVNQDPYPGNNQI